MNSKLLYWYNVLISEIIRFFWVLGAQTHQLYVVTQWQLTSLYSSTTQSRTDEISQIGFMLALCPFFPAHRPEHSRFWWRNGMNLNVWSRNMKCSCYSLPLSSDLWFGFICPYLNSLKFSKVTCSKLKDYCPLPLSLGQEQKYPQSYRNLIVLLRWAWDQTHSE